MSFINARTVAIMVPIRMKISVGFLNTKSPRQ